MSSVLQDETAAAPPPPPSRRPAPAARDRRRLQLPPRGDQAARTFVLAGPVFYLLFNGIIIWALVQSSRTSGFQTLRQLVGLGPDPNYPIFILILLGVLIFAWGWSAILRDVADLRREEVDVEWLNEFPDAPGLVLAPPAKRQSLYLNDDREYAAEAGNDVETLIDDRVRRVRERERDRSVRVSPDELRVIAETRTSRYGSNARFGSSLLLLLAVLGTFAGVKTALPGLIDAVSSAGQGAADITAPLQAVADAFGGNALALVGAIALGLMAQGLSMGRRNLLERLELVSESLYGGLQHTDAADPLTSAITALRDTAESVADAGSAISGVESGMIGLGESFREAFAQLNERLVEVAEQQQKALHERTSQELRELQRRVVDLAEVVGANTRAYQGIVDTVGERARESHEAIDLVRQTSASLQQALQSLAAFQASAERTSAGVQGTLEALRVGGETAAGRMEAAAASLERTQPAIGEIETLLRTVADRMAGADQRSAAAWSQAAREVNDRLGEMVREVQAAGGGRRMAEDRVSALPATAGAGRDPEVAGLLKRVLAAVESERGPSPRAIALAQGVGTLGALGAAYGGYHLVRFLLALAGG
jgi:hypothetical protein